MFIVIILFRLLTIHATCWVSWSSPFSKPCFDVWIWIPYLAGRSNSADKEQVGSIVCIYQISSIVYAVILLIALNPRSQSALLGDRVSTTTSSLLNLLEILLPPLDLYSIKPRWISWLLRWKVLHKLFTSFSPNRGFSCTQLRGFKTANWLTRFSYISWRVATTLACALFDTVVKSLWFMLSAKARMNWPWLMTGPLPSLNCTSWNDIASSARWAKIECFPGETTRFSILLIQTVSKFCAFGSVVLLFCSVSDKFFSSFKTSAISAKFLTKLVVQNLESNPWNLAFSVLCLVSSFEAFWKCWARDGKECQTADTAPKDEAT